MLLDKGADVHAQNRHGNNALIYAAMNGNPTLISEYQTCVRLSLLVHIRSSGNH